MPHEYFSTNAPLSAVGSAAQQTGKNEDYSEAFIRPAEADYGRHKFRVVAGGPPIIENDDYPLVVRAGDSDGDDWPEGWPESWMDSGKAFEARQEARMDNGHGGSKAPFIRAVDAAAGGSKAKEKKSKTYHGPRQTEKNEFRHPGLKKLNKKQIVLDLPPTPRGCEWRRSDDGMNLWRCWTEWDDGKTNRIKKSRYAGHLSDEAWRIMKEYDHEAFISTVGERLRRHSGR
jgi:hypothetical protein